MLRAAGDTLIEVTIALAILSMVLITSTVVATQSYRVGQTARERTVISNDAQGQMEALRAFRDSHGWNQFLNGGSSPAPYLGALTAAVGQGCHVTSPCIHMAYADGNTFVPKDGSIPGTLPTSYVEIVVKPTAGSGSSPRSVDVTINYGAAALGGGKDIAGHIQTTLTDVGFAATPPPPPPPPPCSGAITDIVLVLDTSGSMGDDFGSADRLTGSKTTANGFIDRANIGPNANHVGIINFSDNTTVDIGLTGDTVAAKAAVNNLTADGSTHYVPALAAAQQMLVGPGSRPGVAKVIVFVSDGAPNDDENSDAHTSQMIQAQLALTPASTRVFTIGIGQDGQNPLLLSIMPINGGISGTADEPNKLQAIYTQIAGEITCLTGPAPTPIK